MALFTTGLWWFQGTGTLKLEPEVYVMVGEQRWDEISVWSKGTVCVETPRQERISKETGGDRKERQWVHTSQDWRAGAGCGSEGLLRLCCLCTRQLKTWQLCFKHVVSRVWGIKKYEKKKNTPPHLCSTSLCLQVESSLLLAWPVFQRADPSPPPAGVLLDPSRGAPAGG